MVLLFLRNTQLLLTLPFFPPSVGWPCWVYRQKMLFNYTLRNPGTKPSLFYSNYNLFNTKSNGSLEEQADSCFYLKYMRARANKIYVSVCQWTAFSWSRVFNGYKNNIDVGVRQSDPSGHLIHFPIFLVLDPVLWWTECQSLAPQSQWLPLTWRWKVPRRALTHASFSSVRCPCPFPAFSILLMLLLFLLLFSLSVFSITSMKC